MVEQAWCDVVWDNDPVFELAWVVCKAISCGDEKAVRGKLGVSDVVAHFVVLVSRLVVWDLA